LPLLPPQILKSSRHAIGREMHACGGGRRHGLVDGCVGGVGRVC